MDVHERKRNSKEDRSSKMMQRERLNGEKAEGSDLIILQGCEFGILLRSIWQSELVCTPSR